MEYHGSSGEEPHSGIVASISADQPALVTCVEDERLEFQVGVVLQAVAIPQKGSE